VLECHLSIWPACLIEKMIKRPSDVAVSLGFAFATRVSASARRIGGRHEPPACETGSPGISGGGSPAGFGVGSVKG
jgi:hypothetical protein